MPLISPASHAQVLQTLPRATPDMLAGFQRSFQAAGTSRHPEKDQRNLVKELLRVAGMWGGFPALGLLCRHLVCGLNLRSSMVQVCLGLVSAPALAHASVVAAQMHDGKHSCI